MKSKEEVLAMPEKINLTETSNPEVFQDKLSGTLYSLEFDNKSGEHYLKQLNN